ncbi:hemicentin-1-like [Artemia franciscana]|uniref:hemicentin-1-like n=1 Tax=Artemia franciscana TaxID=6661 RepID=UPI0032DB3590
MKGLKSNKSRSLQLDGVELPSNSNQTNVLEEDMTRRWSSSLTLNYRFVREDHGKILKCVAIHQAFPAKSRETGISLNVQYVPVVTLTGPLTGDLEEGDIATLKCVADANPPATIIWRKNGSPDILAIQEILQLNPLLRTNSGTYTCEARNVLGTSGPLTTELDVKYGPSEASVEGATGGQLTATFGGSARLECKGDGNPAPMFKWLQRPEPSEIGVVLKSDGKYLIMKNVSYDDQGEYICSTSNFINGKEKAAQSSPVTLKVIGPPQMTVPVSAKVLTITRGDEAEISVRFCSDPKPTRAVWQCGHLSVSVGTSNQRFIAESFKATKRPSCYEATLRIQRADVSDARQFTLLVENEKGVDSVSVSLRVIEPVSMTAVIGVIIGCLVFLVLVTLCLLYAFRTERWCFKQKGNFKAAPDIESGKAKLAKNGIQHGFINGTNDLRFNDLQLPRASNNGSMRAKRGEKGAKLSNLESFSKLSSSVLNSPSSRPDITNVSFPPMITITSKMDV